MNIFRNVSILLTVQLFAAHSLSAPPYPPEACKSVPGTPTWPTAETWHTLNTTLDGALLAALPPAIVCDPARQEQFDEAACDKVGREWTNSSFHAQDPVSVDWPQFHRDECLPTAVYNRTTVCGLRSFPHYVVRATEDRHVADTIRFAAEHGVRVSVKATGHDYLGRSTSPGLSIWTLHLKGLSYDESFIPKGCSAAGIPAVSIAAGHRMHEVYAYAAKHNVTVVGGSDPNVGVAGHFTGGGHSPISGTYGLAVDNILEIVLATPSGDIVTANSCQNEDLFWAMRGGGGGTFGVVLSYTTKAIAETKALTFVLQFASSKEEATKNYNKNFLNALVDFHMALPQLTDAGYYYIGPLSSLNSGTPSTPSGRLDVPLGFGWYGRIVNKPASAYDRIFHAFLTKLNSTAGIVNITSHATPAASIYATYTDERGLVGANAGVTSRLWSLASLRNRTGLEHVVRSTAPVSLQGLAVSGPAVRAVSPGSSATLPAWRRAYVHMLIPSNWAFRDGKAAAAARARKLQAGRILADQAPDMGSYLNEADYFDPDYRRAWWGAHYRRLLRIKRRVDPKGVFWCGVCVGAEDWREMADGRVCPR